MLQLIYVGCLNFNLTLRRFTAGLRYISTNSSETILGRKRGEERKLFPDRIGSKVIKAGHATGEPFGGVAKLSYFGHPFAPA